MNKPKLVASSAYATIVTIIFVVVITVWAELFPPLKNWLAGLSGHHWTSKSILSVLVYVVVTAVAYLLPYKNSEDNLRRLFASLVVFTILGVFSVTLFFAGHHFKFF